MNQAIKEASKAFLRDEVPVGCVIVKDDKVLARAHNLRETTNDPLGHAETLAIKKAAKRLGSWRLVDCTIYVTLEPCAMCSGAILNSRIPRIVYGASDPKGGALESSFNLFEQPGLNHHPEIVRGVKNDECAEIISHFFRNKRQK